MKSLKLLAYLSFATAVVATIGGSGAAQNAVPMLINYEGELRSPDTGEAVPDGSYDMVFRIYDVEFGGIPLWEQSYLTVYDKPVEVRDGIFNVLVGSGRGDPLDASIFNGTDRWLEITVYRRPEDHFADEIRVRIWVYN